MPTDRRYAGKGGGEFSVGYHVIGKPSCQVGDGTPQQTLGSGILAVARSIGFDTHRKREARFGHTDHHQLMVIAHHFMVLFVKGTAELAATRRGVAWHRCHPRAVQ